MHNLLMKLFGKELTLVFKVIKHTDKSKGLMVAGNISINHWSKKIATKLCKKQLLEKYGVIVDIIHIWEFWDDDY